MRFTQLSSLFLFFLTFSFVAATPTPKTVAKRDETVTDILNTLKGSVDSVLPQITALVNSGTASDATAAPLIGELNSALGTATSALSGLDSVTETASAVSVLVAPIVSDIVNAVAPLQPSVSASTLGGLDAALSQLLKGLEGLLAGLLNLVATLLVDVANLLRQLAFGLTLGSLGL